MILLPNDCRCGKISVNPKNWKQITASVKKEWVIFYRFYDPAQLAKYPKGFLRKVKGMNSYKTLLERQKSTQKIIELELVRMNDGFNFITGKTYEYVEIPYEIRPTTPFIKALKAAYEKIKTSRDNKLQCSYCLNAVN